MAQFTGELGRRVIRYLRTAAGLDPVVTYRPEDASLQVRAGEAEVDVRLATVPCVGGEKMALRILDPARLQQRIGELGLVADQVRTIESFLREATGLFLVTGPTGSGKTTTLYGLLHELRMSQHAVVTLEDPVEYPVDGIAQIQVDPGHGLGFAAGLRAMLRLDPDYLLVGEMRDRESAQVAVEAAESGHFVMSTLHCPDAAGVVTLLRTWGVPDYQIASTLQLVINQRLVRRLCPRCRRPGAPTPAEQAWVGALGGRLPPEVHRPAGCPGCQQTGYRGRIGVFEVWRRHESDYQLILGQADEHALRAHLRRRGLPTVFEDGLAKVQAGVTSLAEIQSLGGLPPTLPVVPPPGSAHPLALRTAGQRPGRTPPSRRASRPEG
ncbi:MAG: GspE/PulE family protein [Verrucomicrobiota bacterium]